jgi:cardiolipin synthase
MRDLFEVDWAKDMPVELQAWRQRPWREKVRERMAMLLSSQL